MPYFLLFVLLVAGWLGYRAFAARARRRQLLASRLSPQDRATIDRLVPLAANMPEALRPGFEGKVALFLDQITFIGNGGLEVTREMELSIAAQACLLVANSAAWYDSLRTILIYPGAFRSRHQHHDGYVVTERETVRSGESWARGPVVLSWAQSAAGARDMHDGHNVVLHEFAHQLDNLSGHADGAPLLAPGQSFAAWARAFTDAFERHVARVDSNLPTLLDPYAAEGHEEFFAVAVEVFFERPRALKHEEPEVYDQIRQLLQLDPATWGEGT